MDREFFGYANLVANGKQKDGSKLVHLDRVRLEERGVTATITYGGQIGALRGNPELRMTWDVIESWTVQHGFAKSGIRKTPRSQTVIRSGDGAVISFVSKTADAEKMADIARGRLPAELVREDGPVDNQ